MEWLWHSLADPLSFAFMQRALLVAVAVGILCAVVGSYLLVQSLALLGDAISHSLLPGLAIAYMLGLNLFVGAFVAGLLSALLIQWIRSASPLKPDAAMGIVFSAFFALGILLITLIQRRARIDLNHFLFGNLLGVNAVDVLTVVGITLLVLGLVALFFKELTFYSFDPLGAKAAGLPTERLGWGLMVLTSLTLVASMKAVGVLLVLAMLITPAATAYLVVPRLHQVMLLGSLFGVSASLLGMYASYYLNVASGPAIVLVASAWFSLAFLGRVFSGTR
ncbi:metal ABC transporter permease [Synechococcus sp. R55.6]|jgi:ABC-type Mn2+/Zn2+ transport systems, permease components|nr:metal ABC transporter permease [Synechococcus sp. JA-2-3B'a(2-13)]ABD02139.1 manganese/zinc/iron chelate ABC transporter (MZT) family, permease protein [Synechococcus sp. JA-2-3B'a(2-13)]MDT7944721.1 metal ABC transporter permease [Cyanobacteriota bacterium PSP.bin.10]